MAEVSEFHTNEEYEDLIPPLTTQEYSQLRDSIANNGQLIPIIVSNRTGQFVIIDGHHRYRIAQELGREPRYEVRHFGSEAEEIQFISDCNIEGRNLNTFQRAVTILKVKDKLAKIASKNSQANLRQNQPGIDSQMFVNRQTLGRQGVNEKLGKQARTSHETIRKVDMILRQAPQVIIDKAMRGTYSVNKAFKHLQNEQKRQELLNTKSTIDLPDNIRLILGDFRKVGRGKEIPDNSIDVIFTDPFYANEYLYLYRDIGLLGSRVLKPGGSLVLFGAYDLPRSMNLIAESGLKYVHDLAVIHSGPCGMDYPNHIRLKKKTLLWYVNGTKPNSSGIIENVINSTLPDKSLHEMAQSPVEAEYIIKNLTVGENQIVLDPMMGSGTFGIAALKLERQFIGIEIDMDKFEIAKANISRHLQQPQQPKRESNFGIGPI